MAWRNASSFERQRKRASLGTFRSPDINYRSLLNYSVFSLLLCAIVPSYYYFSGNYDQLDDELSADPLRVTLFDSDEKKIWSSPLGAPEGTFSVTTTGGRNMLCITNGIDYDDDTGNEDDRTVGFAVRVRPATVRAQDDNVEGPDTRVMTNLIEMSEDLLDDFQDLNDHQAYLKVREAEHRDLTEATYSRIVRWTVLEALVLMAIAGGQVMYLKKFFEQKRYL